LAQGAVMAIEDGLVLARCLADNGITDPAAAFRQYERERVERANRVSFTLGQSSGILGDWAAKNGSKKTVVVQSDWAPGAEATAVFTDHFKKGGGEILDIIKVPLANPDFAPFLQRARDLRQFSNKQGLCRRV
jgi:ABC-type branched-subunit amino acid transport system substrate-binding protein